MFPNYLFKISLEVVIQFKESNEALFESVWGDIVQLLQNSSEVSSNDILGSILVFTRKGSIFISFMMDVKAPSFWVPSISFLSLCIAQTSLQYVDRRMLLQRTNCV